MGLPILPHVQPQVGTNKLDLRLVDVVQSVLIVCFTDTEHSKRAEKRHKSLSAQSSRKGGGVMLLDSGFKECIFSNFSELVHLDGAFQAATKTENLRNIPRVVEQCEILEDGTIRRMIIGHEAHRVSFRGSDLNFRQGGRLVETIGKEPQGCSGLFEIGNRVVESRLLLATG